MTFPFPAIPPYLKATSLTLASSSTGTSGTVTFPADINEGDIIIVAHGDRSASPSDGAGFTEIAKAGNTNSISTDSGIILSYKIADGTEGGTTLSGWQNFNGSWGCAVYRPNVAATSVAVQDTVAYAGTGDNTANTITASNSANPTISVYAIWEAGNVMTANYGTFSADGNDPITGATQLLSDSGGHGLIFYSKEQVASEAFNIFADIGNIGVAASASGYLEVS